MEAEGSKFHGAANRVTDYDTDRLRETTKLDKLKERNLLRRLWARLNSQRSKPLISTRVPFENNFVVKHEISRVFLKFSRNQLV